MLEHSRKDPSLRRVSPRAHSQLVGNEGQTPRPSGTQTVSLASRPRMARHPNSLLPSKDPQKLPQLAPSAHEKLPQQAPFAKREDPRELTEMQEGGEQMEIGSSRSGRGRRKWWWAAWPRACTGRRLSCSAVYSFLKSSDFNSAPKNVLFFPPKNQPKP